MLIMALICRMDMAHISGLVAAQVVNDPFEYCDVVCTTTYVANRFAQAWNGLD